MNGKRIIMRLQEQKRLWQNTAAFLLYLVVVVFDDNVLDFLDVSLNHA